MKGLLRTAAYGVPYLALPLMLAAFVLEHWVASASWWANFVAQWPVWPLLAAIAAYTLGLIVRDLFAPDSVIREYVKKSQKIFEVTAIWQEGGGHYPGQMACLVRVRFLVKADDLNIEFSACENGKDPKLFCLDTLKDVRAGLEKTYVLARSPLFGGRRGHGILAINKKWGCPLKRTSLCQSRRGAKGAFRDTHWCSSRSGVKANTGSLGLIKMKTRSSGTARSTRSYSRIPHNAAASSALSGPACLARMVPSAPTR